jgi:hypothetical protein
MLEDNDSKPARTLRAVFNNRLRGPGDEREASIFNKGDFLSIGGPELVDLADEVLDAAEAECLAGDNPRLFLTVPKAAACGSRDATRMRSRGFRMVRSLIPSVQTSRRAYASPASLCLERAGRGAERSVDLRTSRLIQQLGAAMPQ